MVAQPTSAELDQAFRALADATRRDILRRTAGDHGISVTTLAAAYDMSFAAVQKHVAVLERAGLVEKQAQGRQRFVLARADQLERVRASLQQLEALWHHRIDALDTLLSQPQD